MLKKMTIKSKLLVISIISIVIALIISIFAIIGPISIKERYNNMMETADTRLTYSNSLINYFDNMRINVNLMINDNFMANGKSEFDNYYNKYYENSNLMKEVFSKYRKNLADDKSVTDENRARLNGDVDRLEDIVLNQCNPIIDTIYAALSDNDLDKAYTTMLDFMKESDEILPIIDDMVVAANDKWNTMTNENTIFIDKLIAVIIAIMLISIIFLLVAAMKITTSIIKPVNRLIDVSEKLSSGDFGINIRSNGSDEISRLANHFAYVADTVNNIVYDVQNTVNKFNEGEIEERLDSSKYKGNYKNLAESINNMILENSELIYNIIDSVQAYSEGNFDFTTHRFKGKKAILHESMDLLKSNLSAVNSALNQSISEITNGNFNNTIDTSNFSGGWLKLIESLNSLTLVIYAPIKDTVNVLNAISASDFSKRIDERKYKGAYKEIANSINITSEILSEHINDISGILLRLANQDLNIVLKGTYQGEFVSIKDSLESVIKNFNMLIKEIASSSEQIAIGSRSIADSGTNLAQGASEQSSAVEELNATVESVAERTAENVQKSNMTSNLAMEAQNNAKTINEEMLNMLDAMAEINQASNNISTIIKAIDDIAFQTNILALNAAVEAARAGEHGKGFAVVAEEVRNLASRSQKSAKETSELIAISLDKAEHGSNIANKTAEALKQITEQIEEISKISTEVAEASEKQNVAIKEINIGLNQIATVVSNNTVASEESATASEELASQSAVFTEILTRFKLKD